MYSGKGVVRHYIGLYVLSYFPSYDHYIQLWSELCQTCSKPSPSSLQPLFTFPAVFSHLSSSLSLFFLLRLLLFGFHSAFVFTLEEGQRVSQPQFHHRFSVIPTSSFSSSPLRWFCPSTYLGVLLIILFRFLHSFS